MPDNSLVICTDTSVQRYDLSGTLLNTIEIDECYVCAASTKTGTLAISDGDAVTLYDTTTAKKLSTLPISGATSLAFSPDDESLATGTRHGTVAVHDLTTGNQIWSATPPGRHRWPWTIPAAILCVWCWIAYRIAIRTNPRGGSSS